MHYQEMLKDRAFAMKKAENIVNAAETANRPLTDSEESEYKLAMAAVDALNPQIAKIERTNTIRNMMVNGKLIPGRAVGNPTPTLPTAPVLSEDYYNAFFSWIGSRGQRVDAALYEGSNSSGGYTVPVIVDGQIVPLAPTEMGVRTVATVLPTVADLKIPRGDSFGTAAAKAEGTGDGSHVFTETDPTFGQFTLSAFMAGAVRNVSWELSQDVPAFQQFAITDLVLAQQMYEGNLYVNGTGTGQAQGLIGNTGAGVTGVLVGTDNYGSELIDASFDVLGKLNAAYHPGASWLMARATGVAIRKAQRQANLFQPIWTRENGRDYLHGYPVTFDGYMPAIAAGATPLLFGDFKVGYVIGDRGGSGINVKILDQPKATEGLLVLLGYRRTDGRVRRSEAIQAITLA